MPSTNTRITETQLNDLRHLAEQMQLKAEAVDDRDTAVMAYAVQTACTELSELRSEHAAAMSTITAIIGLLGTSDEISISGQVSALLAQRDALERELCMSEAKCKGYFSDAAAESLKCLSLAAENAGLKQSRAVLAENTLEACNSIACAGFKHEAIMRGLYASTGNGNKYPRPITTLVDEAMRKLETPSTDAFLAEVRAQGVEELSTLAGNECQRYKSVGDRAGTRKWKSIVILCTDFAAQIRQEHSNVKDC